MKYLIISLFMAVSLFSCGSEAATDAKAAVEDVASKFSAKDIAAQTEAYEKMMSFHDRVMPKMGSIAQMQKMLKEAMNKDKTLVPAGEAAYNKLEDAYDGMMNWMKNMKSMDDLRELGDQAKIMEYVKEESAQMGKIEMLLEDGLASGYKLLGIDATQLESGTEDTHSGHDHGNHDHGDHGHDGHDHSGHNH